MTEEVEEKETITKKTVNKKSIMEKTLTLPKTICIHLVGKEHNHVHHACIGLIFMVINVGFVKLTLFFFENTLIHIAGDITGYGIHGIGLTPFVEEMSKSDKL